MKTKLELMELADFTKSVAEYQFLCNYLPQLESKNQELKDLYDKFSKGHRDSWLEVNYYIVIQTWGNTSCGWESIGGSAISSAYTTIIHNSYLQIICVYYNGKLAYIAKDDEKLEHYKLMNYKNLPGMSDCKKLLNVIYKK